jgi:hypothetical protein
MSHPAHIHDLLEAFRPGIDTLEAEEWAPLREALAQDAQLRSRFESIQQSDRLLRTVMHEVPVPAGLAERLLATLATAEEPPSAAEPTVTLATSSTSEMKGVPPRRMTRRTWGLVVGGALSVASIGLLAFLSWPRSNPDDGWMSREELAGHVQTWLTDQGLATSQGWSTDLSGPVATTYPVDPAVQVRPSRWKRIADPAGSPLVVYELAMRNGKTALLFVSPTPRTVDVPRLPLTRWPLTGSRVAGAWQRSGMLYVLVVDEDGVSLEDFVRVPRVA